MRARLFRLAVVLAAFLGVLGVATAASASTPPTKVQAQVTGWVGMQVKPPGFAFGQGGSTYISNMRWGYWHTGRDAYGTGKVQVPNPCQPIGFCGYKAHFISVYLFTVKVHGSLHYFYNMRVRFFHNGAWHRLTGAFHTRCSACTLPVWIFPAGWPYLL
jgi:hypothetical protein